MIKETISYKDLDGYMQEETLYFYLSKGDIAKMLVDGTIERMGEILSGENVSKKAEVIGDLIDRAYGFKYDDNGHTRFRHATEEELAKFHESEAYGEFIMSIYLTKGKADTFVANLIPSEVVDAKISQ